ncbi:hypothetical protein JCGZ_04209 [Jatropha curcas]|uniref:NADH-ubiquinone oxidoreductase 21kDa subunit N-terminal domain-containing protein n=1 Tax=Jatropha curcas TaxID=180498 RepID=A0A067L7A9_JATCU|nr:hypothetical protein JCGZ_04209 [Jatropha curcas]
MNTDITASAKPEYPVIDRNPPFNNVVGNFNFLDYCCLTTITGVSVTFGYLSGIKPGIKGPSMVTGGLIGLMGGFMYAYQNSAGRLMGFFPNEGLTSTLKNRIEQIEAGPSRADAKGEVKIGIQIAFSHPQSKGGCPENPFLTHQCIIITRSL